jgi:hypothetical protein
MKAILFEEGGMIRTLVAFIDQNGGKELIRTLDLTQDEYNQFRCEAEGLHEQTPVADLRHIAQIKGVRLSVEGVMVEDIARAEFEAKMAEVMQGGGAIEMPEGSSIQ